MTDLVVERNVRGATRWPDSLKSPRDKVVGRQGLEPWTLGSSAGTAPERAGEYAARERRVRSGLISPRFLAISSHRGR
jgi:hypothetical protein